MKPQEKKKMELSAAEGCGPHDDRKKPNVSKTLLPPEGKEGDVLQNANGDLASPHGAIESTEGGKSMIRYTACGVSTYHHSDLHVKGVH